MAKCGALGRWNSQNVANSTVTCCVPLFGECTATVCSDAVRGCLYGNLARRLKLSWEEIAMVGADQLKKIGDYKMTDVFELSGTIRVEFEIHVMRDGTIIHKTARMLKCKENITEQVKTLLGLKDLEVTCTCDGKDLESMTLETLIPSLSKLVAFSLPRIIVCSVVEPQSQLSNVSVEWSGGQTSHLLVLPKREKLPGKTVYLAIHSLIQMGLPITVFVCKQSDPSYRRNLAQFFKLSVTDDTEFHVTVSTVAVKFHTSTWQCTSYEILPGVTFERIIKQMCRNRPEVQDRKVFSKFHKCFFDCDTVISSIGNLSQTEFFIVDIWHVDPRALTKIGSGAYGHVYRYTDKRNESYAVKDLQEPFIWEQRRERREMEILLTTRHPCVLDFVGVNTPENSCASVNGIVTELMDGSIKDGLKSPTEKSIALVAIALGMVYLHENHFIHRDLKPANVLFSRSKDDRQQLSSVKIGDFGSARDLESSLNQSTNPRMTVAFQAPETFGGEHVSYACDVFSFACIYYWLLTDGQLLCSARSALGYMTAVKSGQRPDSSVAPSRPMKRLLERCWDDMPQKRPTFKQILSELRGAKFMAFEGTHPKEVWAFVESVKERERDSENA